MKLIRDNGVLAGLNLREVAESAGVNRGNIYHYFGSRQELLRAAINRRFEAVVDSLKAKKRNIPFVARRLSTFSANDTIHDSQLRALLVLGGDDTLLQFGAILPKGQEKSGKRKTILFMKKAPAEKAVPEKGMAFARDQGFRTIGSPSCESSSPSQRPAGQPYLFLNSGYS